MMENSSDGVNTIENLLRNILFYLVKIHYYVFFARATLINVIFIDIENNVIKNAHDLFSIIYL